MTKQEKLKELKYIERIDDVYDEYYWCKRIGTANIIYEYDELFITYSQIKTQQDIDDILNAFKEMQKDLEELKKYE